MAKHRLVRREEAVAALAAAKLILSNNTPDLDQGESFPEDSQYWLHIRALCREGDNLLKEDGLP
jgi:hypothetical protein